MTVLSTLKNNIFNSVYIIKFKYNSYVYIGSTTKSIEKK